MKKQDLYDEFELLRKKLDNLSLLDALILEQTFFGGLFLCNHPEGRDLPPYFKSAFLMLRGRFFREYEDLLAEAEEYKKNPPSLEVLDSELELAKVNNIEAIKAYRSRTKSFLKEASDAIRKALEKDALEKSSRLGGPMFLVEPGEVISLDEGKSWVLVIHIYEPPNDPEDVMMVTFSDGTSTKYESGKHILYPVYPREKEAAEKAKVTKGWVSLV